MSSKIKDSNYYKDLSSLSSYLHYLDLCSRIVRASLKPEFKAAAMKRAEEGLKFAKWSGGKQSELSNLRDINIVF